ncbi:MAG: ABC transporter permease [Methylocystis silviterrae]|uniref:ABC transporter permease n=1 Tax=Methylocystis silviterrae TaxID=2743612 RepID=UPI003C712857
MKKLDQDPLSDPITVALNLVSETAAAIRQSEEQSAHALQREREIAREIQEQLGRAEGRAERSETMLRLAEAQIEQLMAAVEQMRDDLEHLKSRLAVREAELATSTGRADEAEAGMQKVVDAIRTHLPVKLSVPTE